MTDVEKLLAIAEIKQLMARRCRCVDERDWEGYTACHTPNAVVETFRTLGRTDADLVGAQAITDYTRKTLDGGDGRPRRTSVHHVHEPEIEFTSDTTAQGVWPMEDMLWWEEDGAPHWSHGYGHYHQSLEKIGGKWLISRRNLTRTRVDAGVGRGSV